MNGMWDKEAAERYEAWYARPRGAFALAREQRLLTHMLSAWQRRNHTLLEIGCGTGHFLEMFYNGGFDVTGFDSSEPMLEKARERMGGRATLRIGNAEHLPFEDGEFDFVAMITSLECMEKPENVLAEAFRVATRGVVIAYLNSWSAYRYETMLANAWGSLKTSRAARGKRPQAEPQRMRALQQARWFNCLSICRLIRKVSGKWPTAFRSTLFTPSFLWRGLKPFSLSWAQLLPFGAVSVVRIDLVPVCATPIAIRPRKLGAAAQAPLGVVGMEQYPKSQERS